MTHLSIATATPLESDRPIRLGSSILGRRRHVCAFFRSRAEEYRVLIPFIQYGFECGEKAVHTVDPDRCADHLRRLESAGIEVVAADKNDQFKLRHVGWALETELDLNDLLKYFINRCRCKDGACRWLEIGRPSQEWSLVWR